MRAILHDIREDDRRAGEVVRNMRALLQRREFEREALDVNDLARATIRLMASTARFHQISVETDLAADLPRAWGDRVYIQHVLMNLMANGMDAMANGAGGARCLVVRTAPVGEAEVELAVSDAGPGIPAEVLARIWGPFFTTKKDGMGMGLAICRTIVDRHGGRLRAENRPEGGATLRLTLPSAGGDA